MNVIYITILLNVLYIAIVLNISSFDMYDLQHYLNSHKSFRLHCAVSVKMNMLLYAPGVLLVLLIATGLKETFICLSICAAVQLVLGYPFLSTFPVEYLSRSFDVKRVFMYKWTVNLKFLPEDIFVGKQLSVLLLVLTLTGKLYRITTAVRAVVCCTVL